MNPIQIDHTVITGSRAKSFFMVCSMLFVFSSCENDITDIRAITDPRQLPVQTTYNTSYYLTQRGKLKNKLVAAQLDQYQGEETYILATGGLEIFFFDSLEQEEAKLVSEKGKYTEAEKKFIAWNKVQLTNSKGDRLETEEVVFLLDSAKIFTDKFVTITTESGSKLHGHGLVSNDSFTKYTILKPSGDLLINSQPN